MRCFIAIELERETRDILSSIQKMLLEGGVRGNYTRAENLHLTLKFLGEIDSSIYEKTQKVIKKIASEHKSFVLTMDIIGTFDRGSKKIVWAGLLKNSKLEYIFKDLDSEICEIMPIAKEKHYTPHITLAREAILPDIPLTSVVAREKLNHSFNVSGISLMESTRRDGKLVYLRRGFESFNR